MLNLSQLFTKYFPRKLVCFDDSDKIARGSCFATKTCFVLIEEGKYAKFEKLCREFLNCKSLSLE